MTAYYNEIDPFAAAWLRELIAAGHIADGIVDERSIVDVKPHELEHFTQCHFFAGIGVWSYALRQAGWPDDRPVWTGSCPCQPFSDAGKGGGFDDERHLWPVWVELVRERRPPVVFGEQVASKSTGPWFDLVQTGLEALDYAFGCVPFPSASIGAPHIRDRAYWVAHANDEGSQGRQERRNGSGQRTVGPSGLVGSHWRGAEWIRCLDKKWRPVEPGTFPLVDGAAARVGRLRGYGNAINAEAATTFIVSAVDAIADSVQTVQPKHEKGK